MKSAGNRARLRPTARLRALVWTPRSSKTLRSQFVTSKVSGDNKMCDARRRIPVPFLRNVATFCSEGRQLENVGDREGLGGTREPPPPVVHGKIPSCS